MLLRYYGRVGHVSNRYRICCPPDKAGVEGDQWPQGRPQCSSVSRLVLAAHRAHAGAKNRSYCGSLLLCHPSFKMHYLRPIGMGTLHVQVPRGGSGGSGWTAAAMNGVLKGGAIAGSRMPNTCAGCRTALPKFRCTLCAGQSMRGQGSTSGTVPASAAPTLSLTPFHKRW